MIKLVASWHIPDQETPEEIDRFYLESHVDTIRRMPGLRRHVILKSIPTPDGRRPRTWRAAEIWFDSADDLTAAMASPEWDAVAGDGFMESVTAIETDVFEIEEDFEVGGEG